jgi:hypothetical protein
MAMRIPRSSKFHVPGNSSCLRSGSQTLNFELETLNLIEEFLPGVRADPLSESA